MIRFAVVVLMSLCMSSHADAWGRKGHAVTCEIAYLVMHPDTRAKVDALLRGNPWGVGSFREACSWADDIRTLMRKDRADLTLEEMARYDLAKQRGYNKTGPYHYVNPDPEHVFRENIDCDKPCVITAIETFFRKLADNSNRSDKQDALLFLTHFIGDIHQPLHVGLQRDLGGNKVYADWFLDDAKARRLSSFVLAAERKSRPPRCASLHAILDSCIPEMMDISVRYIHVPQPERQAQKNSSRLVIEFPRQGMLPFKLSRSKMDIEIAKGARPNLGGMVPDFPPTPRRQNQRDEIQLWANQSWRLITMDVFEYCGTDTPSQEACPPVAPRLSSTSEDRLTKRAEYFNRASRLLMGQMTSAGIRMAGFIEQALGPHSK